MSCSQQQQRQQQQQVAGPCRHLPWGTTTTTSILLGVLIVGYLPITTLGWTPPIVGPASCIDGRQSQLVLRHAANLRLSMQNKEDDENEKDWRASDASDSGGTEFSGGIRTTRSSTSSSTTNQIQGVTLKMAFDQQGGVADGAQTQLGRFTCPDSLDMVHRLRRDSDAVLVGRSTVESDDCTLTVRRVDPRVQENTGQILQPVRVVLDPKRTLLAHCDQYKLFTDGLPTLIYHVVETTGDDPDTTNEDDVQPKAVVEIMDRYPNVQWIGLPACSPTSTPESSSKNNNGDHLSVPWILEDLANHRNIHHVMVEGGPATARVFLKEQMVDRAIFVYAPMKFQEPIPSHLSQSDLEQAGLERIKESKLGVDRVEYWCRRGLEWPPQSNSEGGVEIWP